MINHWFTKSKRQCNGKLCLTGWMRVIESIFWPTFKFLCLTSNNCMSGKFCYIQPSFIYSYYVYIQCENRGSQPYCHFHKLDKTMSHQDSLCCHLHITNWCFIYCHLIVACNTYLKMWKGQEKSCKKSLLSTLEQIIWHSKQFFKIDVPCCAL